MPLVTRYIASELFKVFAAGLLLQTLLLVVVVGVREAREHGLPLTQVFTVLPYVLPEGLRFTIPGSLLFAVANVYGRMSSDGELMALKSLGINPWRAVWPAIYLALGLSLLTYAMYDVCALWARPGLRARLCASISEIAYSMLSTQRSFSTPGFSIAVEGVEGQRLLRPTISLPPRGSEPGWELRAQRGQLEVDTERGTLVLACYSGTIEAQGSSRLTFHDLTRIELPLAGHAQPPPQWLAPAALGSHQIPEQIQYEEKRLAELASRPVESDEAAQAAQRIAIDECRGRWLRLQTEPHRRWANGFSCLCFALVGVPVAILRRRGEFLTSFFVCFLPVLLVYYPLLVVGEERARSGAWPPSAVWLGNVVCLVCGTWLMHRVERY